MRILKWVLLFVAVVGIAGVGYYMLAQSPSPQQPGVQVTGWQGEAHRIDDAWHHHRDQVRSVSDYSARVRTNRIVAVAGFLVFVLLTLPRNARGVKAFYRQMMETSPLPSDSGASDENNRRARRLLFFYLLFLLYQIVQFPLTWGRDNGVQFVSDLAIQAFLLVAVAWSYTVLKRGVFDQWKGDPARGRQMLRGRLDGIAIRWRDIRMMAAGIFVAGFTPALLSRLADWGDAFAAFNQHMMGG